MNAFALFFAAVFAVIPSISLAQGDPYPSKPIRFIVPYPPGATVDLTARMVTAKLGERLKQSFVIENMGGAGGIIASETVARSAPNGYTLLFGTSAGMVIAPLLHKRLAYDPVRDFQPISQLVSNPLMLVVNSNLPVKSVGELLAMAKGKPGTLNYGSAGQGAPNHIAMELLKAMTGTEIVHIPYKGGGPAQVDLLSGRIQMYMASIPGLLPNVKAGKFKALAVSTRVRSGAVPDLPTISESGVSGFEFDTWYGIFAPARISAPIVRRLNSELLAVLKDADFVQSLAKQGSEVRGGTPEALGSMLRNEYQRLRKLIESIGLGSAARA